MTQTTSSGADLPVFPFSLFLSHPFLRCATITTSSNSSSSDGINCNRNRGAVIKGQKLSCQLPSAKLLPGVWCSVLLAEELFCTPALATIPSCWTSTLVL